MKKFLAVFCFVFAVSVFSQAHAAEVVERILAVVNDEIITDQDLQVVMAPIVAQYRTIYTGAELSEKVHQAREDFLNKLIEDRLVLSEAKRKQVIVKEIEVDEMIAEVRNKFPNRELFIKALEDQGLTEKKLWARFKDQLMTQKYVNYEVRSKVSVSPGEVNDYYKQHESEFAQGDRVHLQQILIRVGSRTEEEARTLADSLVSQLREGKPFEELAKAYSEGSEAKDGGQMGWIEKGQLLGEIDEKVFSLEPGQVTEPIKSSLGFHIFKILGREKSAVKPIEEVRPDIQDAIFKGKLKKRLEAWVAQLKKNAYISIR